MENGLGHAVKCRCCARDYSSALSPHGFLAAGLYDLAWGLFAVIDPQWLFRFSGMPLQSYPEIFSCLGKSHQTGFALRLHAGSDYIYCDQHDAFGEVLAMNLFNDHDPVRQARSLSERLGSLAANQARPDSTFPPFDPAAPAISPRLASMLEHFRQRAKTRKQMHHELLAQEFMAGS